MNCWDIKGCPASHYMNCEAYERRVSCWVIKKGCLCRSYSSCGDCMIYERYLLQSASEANRQTGKSD